MHVKAPLASGQNGIKQLVQQYGEQLAGVRYRFNKALRVHIKTDDIIGDERIWRPGILTRGKIARIHPRYHNIRAN